jgi:hypothetical protein
LAPRVFGLVVSLVTGYLIMHEATNGKSRNPALPSPSTAAKGTEFRVVKLDDDPRWRCVPRTETSQLGQVVHDNGSGATRELSSRQELRREESTCT